ncbi:protein E23B [Proboscivirus elephantidbeta4]|uniref:Protein E23B n=1 Tax=Elephant endotheliotropic herpesvirus 4 TaxID=548914 RepID=A0A0S1TPP0_9BETA|nr:protein E23B [Elephant endotheliotropic herpesvirus 4]ALM25960.1 protein E23B [Elephant endotheliotropic herpesvirus 4]
MDLGRYTRAGWDYIYEHRDRLRSRLISYAMLYALSYSAFVTNGLWYVLSFSLLLTVLVVLFVYCRNQLRDPSTRKRLDCYDPPSRRGESTAAPPVEDREERRVEDKRKSD